MKTFLYIALGAMQALIIQDWVRVRHVQETEHRELVHAYELEEQNGRINGLCVRALGSCRAAIEVQTQHLDKVVEDSAAIRARREVGVGSKLATAD